MRVASTLPPLAGSIWVSTKIGPYCTRHKASSALAHPQTGCAPFGGLPPAPRTSQAGTAGCPTYLWPFFLLLALLTLLALLALLRHPLGDSETQTAQQKNKKVLRNLPWILSRRRALGQATNSSAIERKKL